MAAPTAALLQDTQKLVQLYNRYPRFRAVFLRLLETKRPVLYRGRPLKSYVYLINSLSPQLASAYSRDYKAISGSFGKENDFFVRYYKNKAEFNKLDDQIAKGGYLGHLADEDRQEIERIEEIKDRKTKKEQYERFTPSGKTKEIPVGSSQISDKIGLNTDSVAVLRSVPSPIKDAASFVKIQTRKVLVNVVNSDRISGIVGTVGNAILGGGGKAAGGSLDAAERAIQVAGLLPQARVVQAAFKYKYIIIGIVVLFLVAFLPGGRDLFSTTPLLHDFLGQIAPPGSITPPITTQLLQVGKTSNRSSLSSGDDITYTLRVTADSLAGERVRLQETIPSGTSFVTGTNNPTLNGSIVEWVLTGNQASSERAIPPQRGRAAANFGRPVQRVSVTVDQIRAELERNNSPYREYAQAVYDAGTRQNPVVDPAFIMAIWRMESAYGRVGGYKNNPGSIVFVSDGYLGGMKPGEQRHNRTWATWDSFEQGLEAIALLIATEYYPKGQTDTWTIHSGLDENDPHAYHCRCDIGIGDITSWEKYVEFYYNWLSVMDQVSGGTFSIGQTVTLTLKADKDDVWISNTAKAFAPGIGEVNSNQVVVKVGAPPEEARPGAPVNTPAVPENNIEIRDQIKTAFGIRIEEAPAFNRQVLIWMWEALWTARQNAPNFMNLLHTDLPIINVGATSEISYRDSTGIYLSTRPTSALVSNNPLLFKQVFIHELGHVIRGGGKFDDGMRKAIEADKDQYLTSYGHSRCYNTNPIDENFAETVAYFVLKGVPEQLTTECGIKSTNPVNPLESGLYPNHLQFIRSILVP